MTYGVFAVGFSLIERYHNTKNYVRGIMVQVVQTMTAVKDTWLKKDWAKQASEIKLDTRKAYMGVGTEISFVGLDEHSLETQGDELAAHVLVKLPDNSTWFAYSPHWEFPWDIETQPIDYLPEWNEINWKGFSAKVSRYFDVREVALGQPARIPQDDATKQRVVAFARELDAIREWWGSPLLINSWYRPKSQGWGGENHPYGYAADFRPKVGDVFDLQNRIWNEWYLPGKWKGGVGLGAKKGFVHLDLRAYPNQRWWNY